MDIKEILNKWAPEYFSRRLYERLTEIRVIVFWFLLILYIIDAIFFKPDFVPYWFQNWGQEVFISKATLMVKLLVAILGFGGVLFTIVIDIIKNKIEAKQVTSIWSNFVKYILIYPFTVAVVIEAVLLLLGAGVHIPALFLLFLLFVFLTINSFYAIIRMGEILVNEAFSKQAKFDEVKNRYSAMFLKKEESDTGTFRLFRFEKNYGRIYIYDLTTKTRYWIKDMKTFAELGYERDIWTEATEDSIPEEYKKYKDGEDIITP